MIVGLMPYHPDHHSKELRKRCSLSFFRPLLHSGKPIPVKDNLNRLLLDKELMMGYDWVVTVDPHLIFDRRRQGVIFNQVVKESGDDIAVVHLAVEMRGPAGAWRKFLYEVPEAARFQRLCSMWRVKPLREIGGFTDVDGRNHVPATTIKLIDNGWKYGIHAEPIAVHEDPDLTLEKWLTQMYKSGKAWTMLQLRHRGHPYMDEKTRYPMTVAQNLKAEQVAKLFWKGVACMRILGAVEALGMAPQHPVPPGKVEVILE